MPVSCLENPVAAAPQSFEALQAVKGIETKTATILLISGDFDKITPALMVATSAASMGFEVTVFFSFWAVLALKVKSRFKNKSLIEKMLTLVLPFGFSRLRTSRMNMLGSGPALFSHLMRKRQVQRPAEMFEMALALGVKMNACSLSMELMGVAAEEITPGVEVCGIASYVDKAARASLSLVL